MIFTLNKTPAIDYEIDAYKSEHNSLKRVCLKNRLANRLAYVVSRFKKNKTRDNRLANRLDLFYNFNESIGKSIY